MGDERRDFPLQPMAACFERYCSPSALREPGGLVTGVTALQSALPAQRLELLKEWLPGMSKVAVFTNEPTAAQLALVRGTGRRMGLIE